MTSQCQRGAPHILLEVGLVSKLMGLYRMEYARNKDEQNVTKAEAQSTRLNQLLDKVKKVRLNL